MKFLNKIFVAALSLGALVSCSTDLDIHKTFDESKFKAPELVSPSAVNITKADIAGESAIEFKWSAADFGQPTKISYSISASYNGSEKTLYTNINETDYTAKAPELSSKLMDMGVVAGEPASVSFSVSATIGTNFNVIKSSAKSVSVNIEK